MGKRSFNRREFLKTAAVLGATATLPGRLLAGNTIPGKHNAAAQTAPPHVILVMADDMGGNAPADRSRSCGETGRRVILDL